MHVRFLGMKRIKETVLLTIQMYNFKSNLSMANN